MAAKIQPLSPESLKVEQKPLFVPPLGFVAAVLKKGLEENFAQVEVDVVSCPDLTEAPFNLASPGICGNAKVLDIGGVPYLVPLAQKEKLYDMKDYPRLTNFDSNQDCLIIGAGAAPWTFLERNAEMMPNLLVKKDQEGVVQKTHIARTHDKDQSYELIALPQHETKMSLLGNLFLSNGNRVTQVSSRKNCQSLRDYNIKTMNYLQGSKEGKVLQVKCRQRKGSGNFVSCMRKALEKEFPSESLGLGGVFCVRKGQVKIHVMPEFSKDPLQSDADVENWLNFYTMDAPFTCFSVFVSRDPGLDLRVEHTHGLNEADGQGGHYHYDTTADIVEYTGYFNLADVCYRVDRPNVTHMIGRD